MDSQKKEEIKENIYCSKYRKNVDSPLYINNNFENKHEEIVNKKNAEKIELFKNYIYNSIKENYNEQCLKNELIKQLNVFLCILYNNKLKNKMNKDIKLTNMNIIDIIISLKNSRMRNAEVLNALCKKYIMEIFVENNVKMEYQIKFFNGIIHLDYLKEVDLLFKSLILKNKESWTHHHILYTHFVKIPIHIFHIPNVSTYILNFFSFLGYLDKHNKNKVYKKFIFLIQIMLKIYPYYEMNTLDKRNIFLLFVLLSFSNSPIHLSSLSFECLKLFHINFIKNDSSSEIHNIVHSSSTHQNISEFITSLIKRNTNQYNVFNEKNVNSFNVDIVLKRK